MKKGGKTLFQNASRNQKAVKIERDSLFHTKFNIKIVRTLFQLTNWKTR